MSFSCFGDSGPSRGTTDSPHRESDERKLIRVAKPGGKKGSRRCRFRGPGAFIRRRDKRQTRLRLARRLQRHRRRLRQYKRCPRREYGSGAPSKRTQKRSNIPPAADVICGTFNARSLKSIWKRFELAAWSAEHSVDILGIQEHSIRFDDGEELVRHQNLGQGWKFVFTSADDAGCGGVGFILSPRACSLLIKVVSHSPRLLQLILSGWHDRRAFFICGYSPTSVAKDEERVLFYNQLADAISGVIARDFLCVLADFNATLTAGDPGVQYSPDQDHNHNTDHLTDLLSSEDLISCATIFPKPMTQHITFFGMRYRRVALDHVLIRKHHRSWLMDINTKGYSVPSIASDHRPLCAQFRIRLSIRFRPRIRAPRRDWMMLKNDKLAEKMNNTLCSMSTGSSSYESLCTHVQQASQSLPLVTNKKGSVAKWDNATIVALRRSLGLAKQVARLTHQEHDIAVANRLSLELAQSYSDLESREIQKQCEIAEAADRSGNISGVWATINSISGRKARTNVCVKGEGIDVTDSCYQHFSNLFSPKEVDTKVPSYPYMVPYVSFETAEFSMEEMEIAIKQMKPRKAPGPDNLPMEAFWLPKVKEDMLRICNHSLSTSKVPPSFLESTVIPIYKRKGDQSDWCNYRPISLMSIGAKLYNRLLLNRIAPVLDKYLRSEQNGFRAQRSTTHHVILLRRLLEETSIRKESRIVLCFVDLTKAFDSVPRVQLEGILYSYRIPAQLVKAIMSLYTSQTIQVSTFFGKTDPIQVRQGVLQGDTLSPFLFTLVMDFFLRKALDEGCKDLGLPLLTTKGTKTRPQGTSYCLTDAVFADDIALVATSLKDMQFMLSKLEEFGKILGLSINQDKTKFLLAGNWDEKDPSLWLASGPIDQCFDFKYLGSWIRNSQKDFEARKAQAWTACKQLQKVWSSSMHRDIKLRVFSACVTSILLYGAESWSMTKTMETRLDGCYTRLLRMALGVSWKQKKTNLELYGDLDKISSILRKRRVKLFGHLYRMKDYNPQPVSYALTWKWQSKYRPGGQHVLTLPKVISRDVDCNVDDLEYLLNDKYEWNRLCTNI